MGWTNLRALRDEDDKLLAAGLLSILVVIFANFFVSPVLLGSPGAPFFWLFSAILMRTYAPQPPAQIRTTGGANT